MNARISSCGNIRAISSRLGGRLRVGALLEQARRTKPSQRSDRQSGSALWTVIFHFGIAFWFIHTPSSEAKPGKCYRISAEILTEAGPSHPREGRKRVSQRGQIGRAHV